mmetsp:Transcript_48238/g.109352  ORF Transcript_48238/g.109352 Transcript_48238/m.109352 type:complete len:117 (-) Transcript_48238:411-761(-)
MFSTYGVMTGGWDEVGLPGHKCSIDMVTGKLTGVAWTPSAMQLVLLGVLLRFFAAVAMSLQAYGHVSGWARYAQRSRTAQIFGLGARVMFYFLLFIFAVVEMWVYNYVFTDIPELR